MHIFYFRIFLDLVKRNIKLIFLKSDFWFVYIIRVLRLNGWNFYFIIKQFIHPLFRLFFLISENIFLLFLINSLIIVQSVLFFWSWLFCFFVLFLFIFLLHFGLFLITFHVIFYEIIWIWILDWRQLLFHFHFGLFRSLTSLLFQHKSFQSCKLGLLHTWFIIWAHLF